MIMKNIYWTALFAILSFSVAAQEEGLPLEEALPIEEGEHLPPAPFKGSPAPQGKWEPAELIKLTSGMDEIIKSAEFMQSCNNNFYKLSLLKFIALPVLFGINGLIPFEHRKKLYNLREDTKEWRRPEEYVFPFLVGSLLVLGCTVLENQSFQRNFKKTGQHIQGEVAKWRRFLGEKPAAQVQDIQDKLSHIEKISRVNKSSTYSSGVNGAFLGALCILGGPIPLVMVSADVKAGIAGTLLNSLGGILVGGIAGLGFVQISNHTEERNTYIPPQKWSQEIIKIGEEIKQILAE
jgi:hypothetical protein